MEDQKKVVLGNEWFSSNEKIFGISERFASINRLITRDLNNNINKPTFSLYTKDEINTYLSNPYNYQNQLRKAVVYMYGASSHFRRLIQYFTGLTDLSYVISPYRINPSKANKKTTNLNYRKVLDVVSSFNIKAQFPKIITVCMREDSFFGTLHVGADSTIVQQLPSEYCAISSIENNVLNVTFDFSYFDSRKNLLDYYPEEFRVKYEMYKKSPNNKWIELDSPTSFAIKCNDDILDYSCPPFAGVLRDVFDVEDYRQLKLSKTAIENYAMLVMKLGMDKDGNWMMDLGKAKEFWGNLDSVLPEEVGSVLSPMDVTKIDFEKSNVGDTNSVSEAEQNLFSAAGVSSLLFNNSKASANALLLSIKADQAITFGIVKNIENMLNRYIQSLSFGKNFKLTFLDCSPYNRDEVGAQYLKACQFGLPMISYYAASQGLCQSELDAMSFLETEVLELPKMFTPLISSTNSSTALINDSKAATDEGGAPTKGIGEISESGEQNQEDA